MTNPETKVDFSWLRPVNEIINDRVLHNGATLLFMATTWNRLYNKFVPMDTGFLANDSVDIYVDKANNVGVVHHKAPYASVIFNAKGRTFRKEKHPNATADWNEAAKAAGLADTLVKDTEAFIKRGGK